MSPTRGAWPSCEAREAIHSYRARIEVDDGRVLVRMRVVGYDGPASAVGDAAQSLRHHAATQDLIRSSCSSGGTILGPDAMTWPRLQPQFRRCYDRARARRSGASRRSCWHNRLAPYLAVDRRTPEVRCMSRQWGPHRAGIGRALEACGAHAVLGLLLREAFKHKLVNQATM